MRCRYQPSFYLLWLKLSFRELLHVLARFSPGGGDLRPFLHRMRGVDIKGRAYIGADVFIDVDDGGVVEIHDGVIIAPRCTIIAHTGHLPGKVVIREKAAIAAGCVIACSGGETLTIGEGAVIAAGSTVMHDIPPFTLCGAPRIKAFGTVTVPLFGKSFEEFRAGLRPIKNGQGPSGNSLSTVVQDQDH